MIYYATVEKIYKSCSKDGKFLVDLLFEGNIRTTEIISLEEANKLFVRDKILIDGELDGNCGMSTNLPRPIKRIIQKSIIEYEEI